MSAKGAGDDDEIFGAENTEGVSRDDDEILGVENTAGVSGFARNGLVFKKTSQVTNWYTRIDKRFHIFHG